METEGSSIQSDAIVKEFLARIPKGFDVDFTDEQLQGIKIAFSSRTWRDHPIDFRRSVGLLRWRYYFVFIAGRDLRMSRVADRPFFKMTEAIFLAVLVVFIALFGLLIIYLSLL